MPQNKLTKVEKFSSYRDKVYVQLKSLILDNTLQPGDTLLERDLADQMGVSRTPVREALKLLEHEGWVQTVPWKGVFVRSFTDEEIKDIIELRIAVETYVMRQITDSIPEHVIQQLSEELEESRRLGEQAEYDKAIAIDERFHYILASHLNNDKVSNLLGNLSDQIQFLGVRALKSESEPGVIYTEHAKILDALRMRDRQAAVEAMESHLKNILSTIVGS